MKLLLILSTCLCLGACATLDPVPTGAYVIQKLSPSGEVVRTYHTSDYVQSVFPPSATFVSDGEEVVVRGSFNIYEGGGDQ